MPPASASRSMTRTSPSMCGASSAAAVRPAGPPPMMATVTCSSAGWFMAGPLACGCGGLERFGAVVLGEGPDVGAAVEPLAAAVHGAGPAPQPVQAPGGDDGGVGVADLAGGDALAETGDAPVLGVAVDQAGVLVRPGEGLAEVRHLRWRRQALPLGEVQPGLGEHLVDVFGDRHAGGQAGGADAADQQVAPGRIDLDEVILLVDGRAQPG